MCTCYLYCDVFVHVTDRKYWHWFDPMNICEGFFAIANVLSFSRLFYLLAANDRLGPLGVSIQRMILVSNTTSMPHVNPKFQTTDPV